MIRSIVTLLSMVFASAIGAEEVKIADLAFTLPDGFAHRPGRGIDSAPGDIVNPNSRLEIHYDIGIGAGSKVAERYEKLWSERKVPFKKMEVKTAWGIGVLLTPTFENKRWAFFGLEPGINFSAKIGSDKDLEDFISLVSSIRRIDPPPPQTKPAEPAGAGQPATQPADKPPAKDQPSTPKSKDGPR